MHKRYVVNQGYEDDSPNGQAMELSTPRDSADMTHDYAAVRVQDDAPKTSTPQEESQDTKVNISADGPTEDGKGENSKEIRRTCCLFQWIGKLRDAIIPYRCIIWRVVCVVLFLLYLAYTFYSLSRVWGTESATRLLVLLVIVVYGVLGKRLIRLVRKHLPDSPLQEDSRARLRKALRWIMYVLSAGGAIVYLAVEVIPHSPGNLVCLLGLAVFIVIGLAMSTDPTNVNWHTVFWGMTIQFYLGVFMLRTQVGIDTFGWLSDRVLEFITYTDAGTQLLFGAAYNMHPYAFQILPIVIFVNAALAVAHHFGIVQGFVETFGRVLGFCLGTTAVESVNAVANIFLTMLEAPLLIFPFLATCSESEMFAIMTGGFASVSAAFLAVYASLGIPGDHLLSASVMSAPAALAIAKVMCPESARANTDKETVEFQEGKKTGLLESVSTAAKLGVTVIVAAGAMMIVFAAFLELLDDTVHWFGVQAGADELSFKMLLSYVCYPIAYLCGSDTGDLLTVGRLTGVKIVANNILAYQELGVMIRNRQALTDYTAQTSGTWYHVGDDIMLDAWNQTLPGGVLAERSVVTTTYMLCGFSNLTTVAIGINAMASLIPSRASTIIKHATRTAVAANIASFLTGCVAGLLYI